MSLSSFLDRFAEPETLKMAKLGRELRAQGIDIIDLSLGEPDFDTPDHIKQAAIDAIHQNFTHYTPVPGYLDLREAVCEKLKRDNQLHYRPEQIVTSTGAKQSLANAILALAEEGDDVIIPTPFWVTYSELVKIARANVLLLKTSLASGFKVTPDQLEAAITPRTKVFLFSSPCNPSGAVYSQEELVALSEVFERHPHVYIISDEIYEFINYVGTHHSIAHLPSVKERTILINGLSKGYAMTGWRLGYLAAPLDVAKAAEKIQGQFTSATCSITQRAAIAALTGDQTPSRLMADAFAERRAQVLAWMGDMPELVCPPPDGAFYVFPDVSAYFGKQYGNTIIRDSADFSMYLLHEAHVSSVMGAAFGEPNCVRFSFANNLENLKEGWMRIQKALAQLA